MGSVYSPLLADIGHKLPLKKKKKKDWTHTKFFFNIFEQKNILALEAGQIYLPMGVFYGHGQILSCLRKFNNQRLSKMFEICHYLLLLQ